VSHPAWRPVRTTLPPPPRRGVKETIEASNLATGATAWSLTGHWTLQRGDLSGAAGKHLYVTDPSGAAEALNPGTGQVQYSLGQAAKVLAVDTSRVYATCGRLHVCAYDINTGAPEWGSAELDAPPALAAEADSVLYLDLGTALNAATGKIITTIWGSAIFAAQPAAALAVGDGRIAVVADPRVLDLYGLPGY
jgi:outer membrane protein assembly factor BamB